MRRVTYPDQINVILLTVASSGSSTVPLTKRSVVGVIVYYVSVLWYVKRSGWKVCSCDEEHSLMVIIIMLIAAHTINTCMMYLQLFTPVIHK